MKTKEEITIVSPKAVMTKREIEDGELYYKGFQEGKAQVIKEYEKYLEDYKEEQRYILREEFEKKIDELFDEGCEDYIDKEDLVCGTFVGKRLILCLRCKYYKRKLKQSLKDGGEKEK